MSMPYYVAPEQAMTDRADFARKGIAKGRALVALRYEHGIVLVAENTSQSLRKVSEIYDRIAFAGVGKYNEFDQLRVAGIRSAELTATSTHETTSTLEGSPTIMRSSLVTPSPTA